VHAPECVSKIGKLECCREIKIEMNVKAEFNVVCTSDQKNWNTRSNAVHANCELSESTTCSACQESSAEVYGEEALGRKWKGGFGPSHVTRH
jgi:hypothetical protein